MQPESPYRYTHMLGACQVGKAWAAVDGQGQFATVAVLDGVAASDERWRVAFGNAANALAQAAGGHRYADANLTAAHPWVAYRAEEGHAPQRLFQSLGMDYQPVSDLPVSAPPTSAPPSSAPPAPPVSGVPQQASGPPHPVSGAPELVAHPPQLPWAMHTNPVSGQPASASPQPVSVAPASPAAAQSETAPVPSYPASSPSTFDPLAGPGRRIAPVQREPKRPKWVLAAGALVLALVAGTAGFFIGGAGGDEEPSTSPSTSASLPPYEATQLSLNSARFTGELAPLAKPWLPRIGGCVSYNGPGAPKLPADEKQHVFCDHSGAWLHFVLYPGKTQKDTARKFRATLNFSGASLAPGLREATRTTGGVTNTAGSYVEYAFEGEDGRPLCGLWWDPDDTNSAFYIETLCEEGMGGNWDALRDLWRRGS
ncbi:hypothetical protein JNW91_17260 [Micromonospora sp. STR1_7]|uniref:Serine/threonine protein kinase n=1 Tax=Micromonospora parastrephiae TaxID=2806101 RepID=A0ABS1XW30_9ACTN|nr:hypothetical protein [Micromonospora parastrephiae]MBM0233450.1 hypothetical protein [Micromonospora parastrephiae]